MRRDPTEFRQRFTAWKDGKKPYKDGKAVSEFEDEEGPGFIRKRLYNNIAPMDYDKPVERVFNAVVLNQSELKDDHGQPSQDHKTVDNLWAEYLKIPKEERKYKDSIDGVTTYREGGKLYTKINNPKVLFPAIKEATLGLIVKHDGKGDTWWWTHSPLANYGQNKNIKSNFVLGDFLTMRKVDPKRGEYVEYTDTWDINPYQKTDNLYGQVEYKDMPWYDKFASKLVNNYIKSHPGKDASFGVGNPLNIKGRIYLEDIYGAPKGSSAPNVGDYFGGWLPEVQIIRPKRK